MESSQIQKTIDGSGKFRRKVIAAILVLTGLVFLIFAALITRYYFAITRGDFGSLPRFESKFTRSKNAASHPNKGLKNVVTLDDPFLGSAKAQLTIVEFADFECPFSKEAAFIIREVIGRFGEQARFIYRDFPLEDVHPHARAAAEAAGCADEQGKFWAMHDKLFANNDRLTEADLKRYGSEVGLDEARFVDCLRSRKYKQEVEEDIAAGLAAGVHGTPTFFINGRKVEGAIPLRIWEEIIKGYYK